jgi:hypothetical protein
LTHLIPFQQWNLPNQPSIGLMDEIRQIQNRYRVGRAPRPKDIHIHSKILGKCFSADRVYWEFIGKNIHERFFSDANSRGQFLLRQSFC